MKHAIPQQPVSGSNEVIVTEWIKSMCPALKGYPPVQGGKSFDMSNVVQEFINKAKQ